MFMQRAAILGVLALLASWSAQAADEFVGARVGIAAAFGHFSGDDVPAANLDNNFIDDDEVGFKAYAQYQFNQWFAVEGAYHYTGNFEDTAQNQNIEGDLKIDFSGFSVQGLLYMPIPAEDFQAYIKAGWYDFTDNLANNGSTISSGTETGLVAGAGGLVRISDNIGVRLDYDWFDAEVGDLWSVNLGVEYYFGGMGGAAK